MHLGRGAIFQNEEINCKSDVAREQKEPHLVSLLTTDTSLPSLNLAMASLCSSCVMSIFPRYAQSFPVLSLSHTLLIQHQIYLSPFL